MRLKCCACLLALLLPTSALDDVWAAADPDPFDDVQTADNNEFTPAVRQVKRSRTHELPDFDRRPEAAVAHVPPPLTSPLLLGVRAHPPAEPPLLYVLMSLQR
jgi:hypothetical protein